MNIFYFFNIKSAQQQLEDVVVVVVVVVEAPYKKGKKSIETEPAILFLLLKKR